MAQMEVATAHAQWHHDISLPPRGRPARAPPPPHAVRARETLCRRRHYTFSFEGKGGYTRDTLLTLDNGDDDHDQLKDPKTYWSNQAETCATNQRGNVPYSYDALSARATYDG